MINISNLPYAEQAQEVHFKGKGHELFHEANSELALYQNQEKENE